MQTKHYYTFDIMQLQLIPMFTDHKQTKMGATLDWIVQ